MTHPPSGPTTPPPPSGPKTLPASRCLTPTDKLLADIDALLVGALAVAWFGPAEQGRAESVRQACAAEVLLYRLRASRKAVRELAFAFGVEFPARREPSPTGAGAVATSGGPVPDFRLPRDIRGSA